MSTNPISTIESPISTIDAEASGDPCRVPGAGRKMYGGKNAQNPPLCWTNKFLLLGRQTGILADFLYIEYRRFAAKRKVFATFSEAPQKKIYRKFKKGLTTAARCVTIVTRKSPPVFFGRKPVSFRWFGVFPQRNARSKRGVKTAVPQKAGQNGPKSPPMSGSGWKNLETPCAMRD